MRASSRPRAVARRQAPGLLRPDAPLRDGPARRHTEAHRRRRPRVPPGWSPDGKWIAYVSWSAEAATSGRLAPTARARPAAHAGARLLSRPGLVARRTAHRRPARARAASTSRSLTSSDQRGSDLVWLPADGGDAHLHPPGPRRPASALRPRERSRLRSTPSRPRLDAVRRHRPPDARPGRRQGRGSRSPRRADGIPPTTSGSVPTAAGPWLGSPTSSTSSPSPTSAARPPIVDVDGRHFPAQAHRRRRRLPGLGRRRQDHHLGRRFQLLPPAVRQGHLRALSRRRKTKMRKEPQPNPSRPKVKTGQETLRRKHAPREESRSTKKKTSSPSPKRSPIKSSSHDTADRHGRAPRGEGHHHAGRRGDRTTATSSSPTTASSPSAQRARHRARGGQGHRRHRDDDRPRLRRSPTPTGPRSAAACSTCRTGASSPTSPTA